MHNRALIDSPVVGPKRRSGNPVFVVEIGTAWVHGVAVADRYRFANVLRTDNDVVAVDDGVGPMPKSYHHLKRRIARASRPCL